MGRPDGSRIYFLSDRGGSMNVWRIAVDERSGAVTGRAEPVTTAAGTSIQHLTVSKSGRLAHSVRAETMNIQQIGFDAAAGEVKGVALPITRGSRTFTQPHLSPDGTQLAFNMSGKREDIFVSRADDTGQQQLTDDPSIDRGRAVVAGREADCVLFGSHRQVRAVEHQPRRQRPAPADPEPRRALSGVVA